MSTFYHNGYEADGHRICRPSSQHPNPKHWSAIRRAALERDCHACRTCWKTEKDGYALECHHRHYDNWGAEHLDDVIMLCIRCHDLHTNDVRLARFSAKNPIPLRVTIGSIDTFVPLARDELKVLPHQESLSTFVPIGRRRVVS